MILQTIFNSDIEALFFIGLTILGAFLINLIISYILSKFKKLPKQQKFFINFLIRLGFVAIIIWLVYQIPTLANLLNNDPLFQSIFNTVSASLSIGLGFAFSGIFSNLLAGMVLFSVRPFEVGDIIRMDGDTGVVRTIKSTTTIIETFDNVLIEKSNNDVVSTDILNYTINLSKIRTFVDFKKELHYSQDLISPTKRESINQKDDMSLKNVFKSVIKQRKKEKIHNYIFGMEIPVTGYHKLIVTIENICNDYTEKFGFKPIYHITTFDNYVKVNFRILTFDSGNIFDYQPKFAKEIYSSIFKHYINS